MNLVMKEHRRSRFKRAGNQIVDEMCPAGQAKIESVYESAIKLSQKVRDRTDFSESLSLGIFIFDSGKDPGGSKSKGKKSKMDSAPKAAESDVTLP